MVKKLICLACGENISMQIDLNKLTLSSDCKNEHHFRDIPFNMYYKSLPIYKGEENNINKKNKNVFYCYICQKNVDLTKIQEHNRHDGIKLSIKEFISKEKCIEYNSSIKHKNFNKELEKINQVIKDFNNWKTILDEKYQIFIEFLNNLYDIEKYFFAEILKYECNNEEKYYDYESLINLKEIYILNNNFKNFRNDYNNNINNNFSKLSYFFINKIKDINFEANNINLKDIEYYYKGNKCFFVEEIKYKKERNDNIFPLIKNLFNDCKHFVGFDSRYFLENDNKDYVNDLGDLNFHKFLLQVKNKFPKINYLSKMRNKSYFSCALGRQIIIIKKIDNKVEIINSLNCSTLADEDFSNIMFALELSNKKLLGISEEFITVFDSFNSDLNNDQDFYKNYFISKKIFLVNKIDDIIQISPKLFCTFSQKVSKIFLWDIHYMEIVSIIGDVKATPGNINYMHRLSDTSLLITGEEYIYILSIINLKIIMKIKSYGLISSFCLLPKKGILCGEIVFNYGPNSPFQKDKNEYNLVQYQINENGIKKISEKIKVHKDVIRNLYYLGNNVILSCSIDDELKIWY